MARISCKTEVLSTLTLRVEVKERTDDVYMGHSTGTDKFLSAQEYYSQMVFFV